MEYLIELQFVFRVFLFIIFRRGSSVVFKGLSQVVSEQIRSMAPTTPTMGQRVAELEDAMENLESKLTELVLIAFEKAVRAMKQSLGELMIQGKAEMARKLSGELDSMVTRLEGRISRAREQHEKMLFVMKSDQDNFQSEVCATLSNFQTLNPGGSEKFEASANKVESPMRMGGHQSHKGIEGGYVVGSPLLGSGSYRGGGSGGGLRSWRF